MRLAYGKIIAATLLFAANPVLFRMISLGALEILWTASVIACLVLGAATLGQRRAKEVALLRRSRGALAGLAVAFTLNNALFITAIKVTTIANAVLTHYLAPVFVVVLGMLLLGERTNRRSLAALLMSLCGLGVILWPNEMSFTNQHFLGLTLGTLSAVFFALEIVLKKLLVRHHRADTVVVAHLMLSALLLAPAISFGAVLSIDGRDLALLASSGVLVSALGITLFTSALRAVKAQHAGIISYLEPLGAVVLAVVVVGELPGLATLLGGALIMLGTGFVVAAPATPRASPA